MSYFTNLIFTKCYRILVKTGAIDCKIHRITNNSISLFDNESLFNEIKTKHSKAINEAITTKNTRFY
jgi:hypothetical protein